MHLFGFVALVCGWENKTTIHYLVNKIYFKFSYSVTFPQLVTFIGVTSDIWLAGRTTNVEWSNFKGKYYYLEVADVMVDNLCKNRHLVLASKVTEIVWG